MDRGTLGQWVIIVGCLYEILALTTGWVPTITASIKWVGAVHPVGKLVVWAWCGYIAWHFLNPL